MAEDTGGKLIWFLAGAALGSTIALLYAPQSGRAMRREIGRRIDRAQESISEAGRDLYAQGRDLYDRGRKVADEAAEMIDRGKRVVEG